MPSRADLRRPLEIALRVALIATLAVALWRSLAVTRGDVASIATKSRTVDDALARALTHPGIGRVDLSLEGELTSRQRDALRALRRSGVEVHWEGNILPMASQVVRNRDPFGGAEIRVVGAPGQTV